MQQDSNCQCTFSDGSAKRYGDRRGGKRLKKRKILLDLRSFSQGVKFLPVEYSDDHEFPMQMDEIRTGEMLTLRAFAG